jgi:hypothetical protein
VTREQFWASERAAALRQMCAVATVDELVQLLEEASIACDFVAHQFKSKHPREFAAWASRQQHYAMAVGRES